jgi:hypothetical protein
VEAKLSPGKEWEALARKMRGPAHKEVRKALNKAIKRETSQAESSLQEAILGLESDAKARGGGGSKQRREFLASRSKSGRGVLPKHTGLRKNIARGITRKITYAGFSTGVRVRADAKYLPPGQRVLVKATNRGKVRHPIPNTRNVWVDQKFRPAGWFDNTMRIYGPKVREGISREVGETLSKLQ